MMCKSLTAAFVMQLPVLAHIASQVISWLMFAQHGSSTIWVVALPAEVGCFEVADDKFAHNVCSI